jgi:hypothetical protein
MTVAQTIGISVDRLENADGTSRLLLDHLGRGLPLQTSDAGAVA